MKPLAYRHQLDLLQEELCHSGGLTCTPEEDKCRQEFRDEVDVNQILARAGAVPPGRMPEFQDINFDLNLQEHLEAVRIARDTWQGVSADLKARFTGFPDLFDAVASGRVSLTPPSPTATPSRVPEEPAKPAVS